MSTRERQTLAVVGDAIAIDASSANSAVVLVAGGSVAAVGANIIFEVSMDSTNGVDGTWVSIPAVRSSANTQESNTGSLSLGVGVANSYYHRIPVGAWFYFRARLQAITSGNVVVAVSTSSESIETAPFIASHAVTMTSTTATPPAGTAVLLNTAATTNATLVVGATSALTELTVSNPTATPAFVKLFNKATAPTVGTDVPIVTIPVAANGFVNIDFGYPGKRFALGIGLAVTGAQAATDTTATVAGILVSGTRI